MSGNNVTLVGNLTRDPELRFTTGGRAIATFGLAVNRRWKQGDDWKEETSFFNVVAWGELGENAATSLTKGGRAIVTGRLEQRSWETQDGEKRTVVEVVADELGPSLRWATCVIERTERTGGDGGYQGGTQAAGGGGRQPDPVYGDEEPF